MRNSKARSFDGGVSAGWLFGAGRLRDRTPGAPQDGTVPRLVRGRPGALLPPRGRERSRIEVERLSAPGRCRLRSCPR